VASGPASQRFLRSYYRQAAAADAAAADSAAVPLCAVLQDASVAESGAGDKNRRLQQHTLELTTSRLRDRATAAAIVERSQDGSSLEAKAGPAPGQAVTAAGSSGHPPGGYLPWESDSDDDADDADGGDLMQGSDDGLDVGGAVLVEEGETDGASGSYNDTGPVAVDSSEPAQQVARNSGPVTSRVQPVTISVGAARRRADTSSAVERPVSAATSPLWRREERMLHASIEALVVLSLQAGARAAASHIVEQVTGADEEVVTRFARAARSTSESAAAATQPATVSAAGRPVPQQTAPPAESVEATVCGTAKSSSSGLAKAGTLRASPALALPTHAPGGSPRVSPVNFDAAALAAMGATLGVLHSVQAQLSSEARLQAERVRKAAFLRLFGCGLLAALCAGSWPDQTRGTRQRPHNALRKQLQPLPPSRGPSDTKRQPNAAIERHVVLSAATSGFAGGGKFSSFANLAASDPDIGLCDSPLLAYLSAKRLRVSQPIPTGSPGKAGGAIGLRGESGSNVTIAVKPHAPSWELRGTRGLSASQRQIMLPEHSLVGQRDPSTNSHRTPMQPTVGRTARVARASYQASRWQVGSASSGAEPVALGRNPLFELRSLTASSRGAAAAAGGLR